MKVSDMMNQSSFKRPINFRPGDDRFIGGGFLAPFLLGGITGGLLAPAFYPRPIPLYGPYPINGYPIYPTPYTGSNQYYYYN